MVFHYWLIEIQSLWKIRSVSIIQNKNKKMKLSEVILLIVVNT